jgi:hypothetical protein
MSQGAASYLVRVLDESSRQGMLLSKRLGIRAESLQEGFCRGLASTDSREYERGVGRVHIADMLTETLDQWPEAPHDGVVQELVAGVTKLAVTGDKPKALAFLDALEACSDLSNHKLDVRAGVGERLGRRLYVAAVEAPNNRVYHPARAVHNRFVTLIDMGIGPEHNAFPRQLFEEYLQGAARVTSDEQRLALERYVRILERLDAAGLDLKRPEVQRFVLAMRDRLTSRHDVLAAGITQLGRLLAADDATTDASAISRALHSLTDQLAAQ